MRSLLALKLFGSARHSHVMNYVLDEGLGLFAGLNAIPKRAFSEREILVRFQKRSHNPLLIAADFDKVNIKIPWLGRKRLHLIFG